MASGRHLSRVDPNDPRFSRKRFFFLVTLRSFSWRVSQSPIRVVILFYMDHIIIIIGEWRSDAICNDPRLWINHGSTMDQHGSTWIKRPSAFRHGAFVMRHASCVMRSALSPFSVLTPDSWLMRHAFSVMAHASCVQRPDSRLMAHASCSTLHASSSTRHASGVMTHGSWLMRPGLMRPAS